MTVLMGEGVEAMREGGGLRGEGGLEGEGQTKENATEVLHVLRGRRGKEGGRRHDGGGWGWMGVERQRGEGWGGAEEEDRSWPG